MPNEYEVIRYPQISNLNLFVVRVDYRTAHLHRDFEIDLLLAGRVELVTNNESTLAEAGELLLLNPNQPHELRTPPGQAATILCVQLSPNMFREAAPDFEGVHFGRIKPFDAMAPATRGTLARHLLELGTHYLLAGRYYELVCTALLNLAAFVLLENVPFHVTTRAEQGASEKRLARLSRILDYVDGNYMQKIRLADIAAQEGVTVSHLSAFVAQNLNQTFQAYVNSVRFNRARKLLLSGGRRLIDICVESGFSDIRYMKNAFIRHTGLPPEQYRLTVCGREPDGHQGGQSAGSSQQYLAPAEALPLLRAAEKALPGPQHVPCPDGTA